MNDNIPALGGVKEAPPAVKVVPNIEDEVERLTELLVATTGKALWTFGPSAYLMALSRALQKYARDIGPNLPPQHAIAAARLAKKVDELADAYWAAVTPVNERS